jgi:hypothetical protein
MKILTKVLLTLIMLTTVMFANSNDVLHDRYMTELENLNSEQRTVLYKAYSAGIDADLQYTLTAIAWKESNFGVYFSDLGDGSKGSFGPFHALLDTVVVRYHATNTWQTSRLAERLIKDFDFAASVSIAELQCWKQHWKSKGSLQNRYMIASYNAGYKSYTSPKGREYALDILLRMRILQEYFKKHDTFKVHVPSDKLTYNQTTNIHTSNPRMLYTYVLGAKNASFKVVYNSFDDFHYNTIGVTTINRRNYTDKYKSDRRKISGNTC